jgi:hypothetical protein
MSDRKINDAGDSKKADESKSSSKDIINDGVRATPPRTPTRAQWKPLYPKSPPTPSSQFSKIRMSSDSTDSPSGKRPCAQGARTTPSFGRQKTGTPTGRMNVENLKTRAHCVPDMWDGMNANDMIELLDIKSRVQIKNVPANLEHERPTFQEFCVQRRPMLGDIYKNYEKVSRDKEMQREMVVNHIIKVFFIIFNVLLNLMYVAQQTLGSALDGMFWAHHRAKYSAIPKPDQEAKALDDKTVCNLDYFQLSRTPSIQSKLFNYAISCCRLAAWMQPLRQIRFRCLHLPLYIKC